MEKYYPHQTVEQKIRQQWLEERIFHYTPDERESFTMVVPPPNVTGVLHLGHALNATIQDILARQARIAGKNVCWIPGCDHASIATEAKVLAKLKAEQQKDKKDLTREAFLAYAQEWKNKHAAIIYDQFKQLGCSMDWDRQHFTMDDNYYAAVIEVFVKLYQEGFIYKDSRMIHWDTIAQTALSDEEVEYRDEDATLYFIKYIDTENPKDFLSIATKRPETIMGDVAIAVHPDDKRYKKWIGKKVWVPLVNRSIPVITDKSIDPSFGTGVLKVTPAHALEDYRIGKENKLPIIHTFLPNGTLSDEAQIAVGATIAEAKDIVLKQLKEAQLLIKTEVYKTRIGYSQRTNAIIEPFISTQWFVKMKSLAKPALEAVHNKDVQFFPDQRFDSTYNHWMNNIKDWCISRQLWWGQRIPAWYDNDGNMIVATNEANAYNMYKEQFAPTSTIEFLKESHTLTQDPDCLDTWFSSWIWPIEVFEGLSTKNNKTFQSAYPTSVLVTGHDIIFFWVARMIMAGLYLQKEIPFRHVYFTGMVRDAQGRKMSKSLGNSPDLMKLIELHGADAVRFGVMIASPAGNDLLFDEESITQGKNFNNKLWNVWKLILMMQEKVKADVTITPLEDFANQWMMCKLDNIRTLIDQQIHQYKLSEALKQIYSLLRNTFCNTYMEWLKVGKEDYIASHHFDTMINIWRSCLQLLHPYMPFVSESLFTASYQEVGQQNPPRIETYDAKNNLLKNEKIHQQGNDYEAIITEIRDAKQSRQLSKNEDWHIYIGAEKQNPLLATLLQKILKSKTVIFTEKFDESMISIPYEDWQIKLAFPMSSTDKSEQQTKLQKDLQHQLNMLAAIEKKLSNARFLENAKPEIIALEQTKLKDTKTRIASLQQNL